MTVLPKVLRRSCALAMLAVLVACGDDDPEPLSAVDETTPSTSPSETSAPPSSDTAGAEPVARADLEFRPVLQMLPPGGVPDGASGEGAGCIAPDGAWTADQVVLAPQLADAQEVGCLELGPAGTDDVVVESAQAVEDGIGSWTIALVLTNESVEAFNETVGACFDGAATCPTRQLAIVVDRTVLSAPSINAPAFERDSISISGGFTRAEAEALAAGLG